MMTRLARYFPIPTSAACITFWTAAVPCRLASMARVALASAALVWSLQWFFQGPRWLADGGPLELATVSQMLGFEARMSLTDSVTAMRPSLLVAFTSPSAISAYAVASAVGCLLVMLGIGGRGIVAVTWVMLLGWSHRVAGLTGPGEDLLVGLFPYLLLDPGKVHSPWRTGFTDGGHRWSSGLAVRCLQVHLALWMVTAALSHASGLVWWQGESVWWMASAGRSNGIDAPSLLSHTYLGNFLSHLWWLSLLVACIGWILPQMRGWSWIGWLLYGAGLALFAGDLLYGVVALATSMLISPWLVIDKPESL
jgi:hypothetical protein